MVRPKTVSGLVVAFAFLALVSTARADMVHMDIQLEKLVFAQNHHSLSIEFQETGYLYAGHFENNNGKHLGFSMQAVSRGPRFGIVRPQSPDVSENPEPTTLLLLGTGVAAAAGFARKKGRLRGK